MTWRMHAGSVLLTFTLAAGLTASGMAAGRKLPPALARELPAAPRQRRRVPRKVMVPKRPTPAHVAEQLFQWRARLRYWIHERGYTIAAVNRSLGWTPGYLSQVLCGKVVLKVERLLVLLDFLGVPIEAIVTAPSRPGVLSESLRRQVQDEAKAAARAAVAETLARWPAGGRGGPLGAESLASARIPLTGDFTPEGREA